MLPTTRNHGNRNSKLQIIPWRRNSQSDKALALSESSSWYPSTPPSPGCPTYITNTASTLKCCATATKRLRLPPFSLFSVITSLKTCMNKRTISERSSQGAGYGLYHGYRNAAEGRRVSGEPHEAA